MAEAFIGMTVTVKLKPGASRPQVTGKVVNIHDQTLILEHVRFPESGDYLPSFSCPAYQIADLAVIDSNIYQPTFPSGASTLPTRVTQTSYSDPAILSYDRPTPELPQSATPVILGSPTLPTPIKELPADIGEGSISAVPLSAVDHSSPKFSDPQKPPRKSKGWRSTPLLEEADEPTRETPQQQPRAQGKAAKQKKKYQRTRDQAQGASQNGWATEDAIDVQDLGDFDFEANLSKFDKKAVFSQIRNEDTTADEDRLITHNRARPGTNGGKNLHPTEMVLSPSLQPVADSEVDGFSDVALPANGRTSRQSARSQALRGDGHDDSGRSATRTLRSVASGAKPLNASMMSSTSFNRSTSSFQEKQAHFDTSVQGLRVKSTGELCPSISPLRLRQTELDSIRRGVSAAAHLELSARAIAEALCRSAAAAPAPSRRNSKSTSNTVASSTPGPRPVIVVLAGNHAKGAEAIAAVRHLFGRGFRFLLSIADFGDVGAWHEIFRTQIEALRAVGKRMNARLDSWPGISAQVKKLSSPPALIVDALLDGTAYGAIEDVQAAIQLREIIDWTNRSRASAISIECPSGYDADTGETTVMEGEPVAVKPDRVLSLGAVVTGVSEALADGEKWEVSLLDVGISPALRSDEGVRFGYDWHVDLEFSAGD